MNEERPIEKALRRHAQKRAAETGAPPALHPVNRRALQAEVARRFGKAPAPVADGFWARWRRPLRIATLTAAGVTALVILLVPSGEPTKSGFQLASGGKPVPPDSLPVPAPAAPTKELPALAETVAPPAAIAPAVIPDQSNLARPEPGALALNDKDPKFAFDSEQQRAREVLPTPSPAKPQPVSSQGVALDLAQGRLGKAASPPAAQPVASVLSTPAASAKDATGLPAANSLDQSAIDRADSLRASGGAALRRTQVAAANPPDAALSDSASARFQGRATVASQLPEKSALTSAAQPAAQSFSNFAVPAGKAGATTDEFRAAAVVLQHFEVTQAGNELRVVDQDGSIYRGLVAAPANGLSKTKVETRAAAPRGFGGTAANGNRGPVAGTYPANDYRVTGTNRTLNVPVEFTWNFVPLTNALPSEAKASGTGAQQNAAQNLRELLQNSSIQGRARLTRGREIEVQARPVPDGR